MALGIYHNPELWFGARPNPTEWPQNTPRFDKIIATQQFDTITISVSRDGLFVFDFSEWPEYQEQEKFIERRSKQIEIMNSYLLCFYSAVATRGLWIEDHRQPMPMMRADQRSIFGVFPSGFGSADLTGDLARLTYRRARLARHEYPATDLMFSLPEEVPQISLDLFSSLWRSRDNQTFTLADLLFGAHISHFHLRFAEALGLAWHAIETLVNQQWENYLVRNRERDGKPFITGNKKDSKTRMGKLMGRDYSASVQIEILSLLNEISYQRYTNLSIVRKARNAWIHELESATRDESAAAIELAEELFREKYSFDTTLPALKVMAIVGGGGYIDKNNPTTDPLLREFTCDKRRIHLDGLDKELRLVLGQNTTGLSYNGQTVSVHLLADASQEDEALAAQVIEAHDPAFLEIDEAHRLLPGEYKYDSPRYQPHVKGDDLDKAIVTIELPHTDKSQIIALRNNKPETVNLRDGIGQLIITSDGPPGTRIKVSVQDHPCNALEIEVVTPPDPS